MNTLQIRRTTLQIRRAARSREAWDVVVYYNSQISKIFGQNFGDKQEVYDVTWCEQRQWASLSESTGGRPRSAHALNGRKGVATAFG